MARPHPPDPVKCFVAVLWRDLATWSATLDRLQARWGAIDFVGADHLFDCTNYYEPEMGCPLYRRLIAFERLISPETLPESKLFCIDVEDALSGPQGRRVNLDVGYLDHNKIVLASIKPMGQKIYLSSGIYADLVARYSQGRYRPFEWTFLDFKDGRYDKELEALRKMYLDRRRLDRKINESEQPSP